MLTFKQVFQGSHFGAYSHKNMIGNFNQLAESCKRIDDLYLTYLKNKNPKDCVSFFKKPITDNSVRTCLLTKERAHKDLQYVYGGESDTEDEDYGTELSF